MAAVLPPILSDRPPEVPRLAGLGGRFHYFRGGSGQRYLFSTVRRDELADFRGAVVMLAHPARDGRLATHWIAVIDAFGRPPQGDRRRLPPSVPGEVVLIHLLSASDGERQDLVADLLPLSVALAA